MARSARFATLRGVVPALLLAAVGSAAQEPPPRLDEGPLENTAYLPSDDEAAATLARADALFASLFEQPFAAADERRWREMFDLWHVALRDSELGATTPTHPSAANVAVSRVWKDPDGTADVDVDRRRDGVEVGVLRRLRALSAEARAAWRDQQAPLAKEALVGAGLDADRLARVERDYPGTESAVRAALACCDGALEAARAEDAASWCARARQHVALVLGDGGDASAWELALGRRDAWIAAERSNRPALPDAAWSRATSLEARGVLGLEESRKRGGAKLRAEPGQFVRPGLAFLDARLAAVHFAADEYEESLALYDLEQGAQVGRTNVSQFLREAGAPVGPLVQPPETPGWPLTVAARGSTVVLTVGRRGASRGNALLCIDVSASLDPQTPPNLRTRWAWYDGAHVAGLGLDANEHEVAWQGCEFQPGAVIVGDTVLVSVREYDEATDEDGFNARQSASSPIRTSVAALDLVTGRLRWTRWIGRGVEIQRSAGRFVGARSPAASASPLSTALGSVILSSNTGFVASLEVLDGRVNWALRTRRRPSDERRWTGAAPSYDEALDAWAVGPADSDQLYWLRRGADLDGAGVFAALPRALDAAAVLIGAEAGDALALAPHGPERALTSWHASSGRTRIATYLGPEESFTGDGVASDSRALFATNRGLYLVDLERELFLLDYAGLGRPRSTARTSVTLGGSVFVGGPWACVLGPSALWIFALR